MRRIVSLVTVTMVLALGTRSEATTETRTKYVVTAPNLGTIEVDCSDNVHTAIRALEPIKDFAIASGDEYEAKRSPNDSKVLRVQPRVANPDFTTLQFLSGGQWFTLELRRARGVKPVSDLIFVRSEDDIPELEVTSVDHPSTRTPVQDLLAFIAEGDASAPAVLHWREKGHRIEVRIGAMRWGAEHLTFRFELHNKGDYPYPITALFIADASGNKHEVALFPRELASGESLLQPRGKLVGALRVSNAVALRAGWSMKIRSSAGVPSATVRWDDKTHGWTTRGPIQERLVVAVHAAGGATKLDDGIGVARNVWTTSQTLGARVLYGAMKHVSIEGNLDVTRTGSAVFEDSTWGAEQGTLETHETAGRVMVGALLHTAGKRLDSLHTRRPGRTVLAPYHGHGHTDRVRDSICHDDWIWRWPERAPRQTNDGWYLNRSYERSRWR